MNSVRNGMTSLCITELLIIPLVCEAYRGCIVFVFLAKFVRRKRPEIYKSTKGVLELKVVVVIPKKICFIMKIQGKKG